MHQIFYRYLKKKEYIRPAKTLNIRQRKSFRSRTKNSSLRPHNDIFFDRSKHPPSHSETNKSDEGKTPSFSTNRESQRKGTKNTKSKRPNVILMMSDDQVCLMTLYQCFSTPNNEILLYINLKRVTIIIFL